jgi:hypothetical protein
MEGPWLKHGDDWWKHRSAILWRAGVGVTLCKPKTMGENLSGKRGQAGNGAPKGRAENAPVERFHGPLPEGFSPQARGVPQAQRR